MSANERRAHNQEFLRRLIARRPQDRAKYEHLLRPAAEAVALEAAPGAGALPVDVALETIVREERPVLFLVNDHVDTADVSIRGPEAKDLVARVAGADAWLRELVPLVGRIDVTNFPGEFVGTGWFVDEDVVVTNRHVASLIARWDGKRFAFNAGVAGQPIGGSLCTAHEKDDRPVDGRTFAVKAVLYIERDAGPNDIAFLRVERRASGNARKFLEVQPTDAGAEALVATVGYPARASPRLIPDQALMADLFRDRYDVKRIAPGFTAGTIEGTTHHDCTTLGGASGSVMIDLATRQAAGLHFAGLYQQTNYAVRASVLKQYVERKRWNEPYELETTVATPQGVALAVVPGALQATGSVATGGGELSVTVPVTITVRLGAAAGAPAAPDRAPSDPARAEAAAVDFWDHRPPGVLAVRVGFIDAGDAIGDQPCVAAAVLPSRLAEVAAAGPASWQGFPVRYLPAEVGEQLDAAPDRESVDAIAYDDEARTSPAFSFEPVEQAMELLLHVGPEYSWDVLKEFLAGVKGPTVSAMYEFHSPPVKEAIEARLEAGASLKLVLDNATFSKVKDEAEEFDRVSVFEAWAARYRDRFERIVAPEGRSGLISDAYHIKVTVRTDGRLWLSSGNWKMGSSQPVITQDQRDHAADVDLPGNREWHVVVDNETLANRFRSHILQDHARSKELGGGPTPRRAAEETVVEVPEEESVALERKPPSRLLAPRKLDGRRKVRPLLTPDQEGAIYSEAVLELIDSARERLLFQIPYIAMPSNPRADRGYIDQLLRALVRKLKTLPDARVILRAGGSAYSSPVHAAWYLKSKGVDVAQRLRSIENHHTKGMIVDGRRVLLGSHNWSKPGVTLNRDASLLFDDAEVASYYTEAFEIDWARANPIRPKRYVKPESPGEEAPGTPRAAYRRRPLGDLLRDP